MNPLNPLTQQPLSDGELQELRSLINQQLAVEAEIVNLEEQLKRANERLHDLSVGKIPEKMNSLGLKMYVLTSGESLVLKPLYQCYLSDEHPDLKQRGLAWLRANKLGTLIKKEVKVQVPQDNEKLYKAVRTWLDRRGILYGVGEGVANPTLRSLMRERLEGGKEFPMDIFRGFAGSIAKIDRPK